MNDADPTRKPRRPFRLPANLAAKFGEAETAVLCDAIGEVEEEAAAAGFHRGLECALGRDNADLVLADLTGHAERSNASFARERGVTRQAIGKMLRRCRRNLGFPPLRVPGNSRPSTHPRNGDFAKSKK